MTSFLQGNKFLRFAGSRVQLGLQHYRKIAFLNFVYLSLTVFKRYQKWFVLLTFKLVLLLEQNMLLHFLSGGPSTTMLCCPLSPQAGSILAG